MKYNDKVDELIEKANEILIPFRDSYLAEAPVTEEVDKVAVEKAISDIYRVNNRGVPLLIWCQSPWQGVAAAGLTTIFAQGDGDWRKRIQQNLNKPLWQRCATNVIDNLNSHTRRISPDLWGKPWVFRGGDRNMLFRDLITRLDDRLRDTISSKQYTDLRTILYAGPIPQQNAALTRVRRGLPPSTPDVQITQYLQMLSSFSRGGTEPPNTDSFSEVGAENDDVSIEEDFLSQLPESMAFELYNKRNFSRRIDMTADECFSTLRLSLSVYFRGAIGALTWSAPQQLWLPLYAFPVEFLDPNFYGEKLSSIPEGWRKLIRYKVPFMLFETCCVLIERPQVQRTDERGRLHSENSCAIKYADGFQLHSWHGVTVPEWIIIDKESITLSMIEAERNTELRRVLIERFGEERFIKESGADIVHEDDCGVLYKKDMTGEVFTMVRVINSTEEPDGTRRHYFLRVPEEMQTAREAVAWTFGMPPGEYNPAVET
ncbi:MAG: hypothetical protein K2X93_00335 [Candidatus Obscuribacterales bacterium]|nr:hypothetical protein [Candidatus Obscuribacterales bacterium]